MTSAFQARLPPMRILLALAPLAFLAACASLSETECRSGNWFEIGRDDGSNGRAASFIREHAKACNDFGIAPNAGAWRKGREEGLKTYCTRRNAYDIGARGRTLSNVCPASRQSALEDANDRGRTWHRIGREIAQTRSEIAEIDSALASLALDDPARAGLISQRSFLRLDLLTLRARRAQYRF